MAPHTGDLTYPAINTTSTSTPPEQSFTDKSFTGILGFTDILGITVVTGLTDVADVNCILDILAV